MCSQRRLIICIALLCALYQITAKPDEPEQNNKTEDVSVQPVELNDELINGFEKRSLEQSSEVASEKADEDLDAAETLVFRPFFGYRYLLNRRRPYRGRYSRSVDGQEEDLNADETLVFRPFFRRRFGYARRRFPYYYYY